MAVSDRGREHMRRVGEWKDASHRSADAIECRNEKGGAARAAPPFGCVPAWSRQKTITPRAFTPATRSSNACCA
jgi:hypothetical protein